MATSKNKKSMTIEDLAVLMQGTMASKEDLASLATTKDLNGVKEDLKRVKEDLKTVKEDLNGVKEELKADLQAVKQELKGDIESLQQERNYGREIDELRASVTQIKKHLGIKIG